MEAGLELNTNMIMVLCLLGLTIILFVFELLRVDVAAFTILVLLGLLGLVPPAELFQGFASDAVIAIIATMILGAGLDRTGMMQSVANLVLRFGGSNERRITGLITGSVGIVSSVVQNTGAAALFMPVTSRVGSRSHIPLSRLLMPMAFCTIVGGTITMVGSSPMLLLNDLIENSSHSLPAGVPTLDEFGLFEVAPVGISLLIAAILYFLFLGRHLMPRARGQSARAGGTRDYFADAYGIHGDVFEVVVGLDSPLVGSTVGESEASVDAPMIVAIRAGDESRLAPPSDEMIWTHTVLGVMGSRAQVEAYAKANDLRILPRLRTFGHLLNPARAGISEVVITPGSNLAGKTIGDVRMRKRYGLNVLAVYRGDEVLRDDIRDLEMRAGDSLVIHSSWRNLADVARERDFIVATDFPKEEVRPHKLAWALACFALAIGLILFSDFQASVSLMAGALGMVLTGVVKMDEAYKAVSWKTVFLLAGLIPLGYAMEITGTAGWMAQGILELLGGVGIVVLQIVLALLTTFFTLVMTNVGATVLLVPLAISLAVEVGAQPEVFALIIALSASNAFLIPTHQVNSMVMGPGGYRVADFLRVGGLLSIIYLAVLIGAVNLFF